MIRSAGWHGPADDAGLCRLAACPQTDETADGCTLATDFARAYGLPTMPTSSTSKIRALFGGMLPTAWSP